MNIQAGAITVALDGDLIVVRPEVGPEFAFTLTTALKLAASLQVAAAHLLQHGRAEPLDRSSPKLVPPAPVRKMAQKRPRLLRLLKGGA